MTELLYLSDFDVESCDATVVSSGLLDSGLSDIILDRTCFYPRGGGQDWDKGIIDNDEFTFEVAEVRLDEGGIVHHVGQVSNGSANVGDVVSCAVDRERRVVNTRLHSAGHVIDMAVDSLGLDWAATKGQHYPDLSADEYSGTWEPERSEELKKAIESRANEFVAKGTDSIIRFISVSEMHTICRHVPENIPTNKPARVVMYGEDFGIPCGGTHVKSLKEIGEVKVPKLREKKGVIRVNYTVAGIN